MVLESMRRALSPIGLYDLSAPAISAELQAYADEIERLYAFLDDALPQRFLSMATDEGLCEREEYFGPARSAEPVGDRRRYLRLRFSLGEGDFTPAGIRKALDSFGLEYVIAEFPADNRLNIIAQADYTNAQRSFIRREVGKIIPSHIEYQLVFNTLTWAQLDARNKTFDDLDQDNLTWDEIDSLE